MKNRKLLVGKVVSDKMMKTIVVKTEQKVRHPLYGKYVTKSVKFKAHDEKGEAKSGDTVEIMESRPLSHDKRWVLTRILEKAV